MKITKERLRQIIKEEIDNENAMDNKIEMAEDYIADGSDGPVNEFVAIVRALELVKKHGDIEPVANALLNILERLSGKKEIPSSEFPGEEF